MTDPRVLLTAFVQEWEAGRRPNVEAVLTSAPAGQQGELTDAIETFLCNAPLPRYDEQTLAALESSQPVREAARAIGGRSGTWPLLLPALRRERRLTREEVAERLGTDLGYPSAFERVRQHLHAMEYGTADARRVSSRVLAALARVLGTTFSDLARAGHVETLPRPTAELAAARRGFPDAPPFSEVPSGYRRPGASEGAGCGEVDRLFLGGEP
jgi:transcriptional regulator with XRE-family HTH domain